MAILYRTFEHRVQNCRIALELMLPRINPDIHLAGFAHTHDCLVNIEVGGDIPLEEAELLTRVEN